MLCALASYVAVLLLVMIIDKLWLVIVNCYVEECVYMMGCLCVRYVVCRD